MPLLVVLEALSSCDSYGPALWEVRPRILHAQLLPPCITTGPTGYNTCEPAAPTGLKSQERNSQAEQLLEDAGGDVAAALNLHYSTDVYTAEDQSAAPIGEGSGIASKSGSLALRSRSKRLPASPRLCRSSEKLQLPGRHMV